jgi:hypothetical protein
MICNMEFAKKFYELLEKYFKYISDFFHILNKTVVKVDVKNVKHLEMEGVSYIFFLKVNLPNKTGYVYFCHKTSQCMQCLAYCELNHNNPREM